MAKDCDGADKRRFQRIVFSANDEVMGVFAFPKVADGLNSYIIADISAGGLRFFAFRKDNLQISTCDKFYLKEIKGKTIFDFDADVELEVRWVIDNDKFEHIMIGCRFLNISEAAQTQIELFIELEQVNRNHG
jgi:c-di-GMP-binding flagellar brake protein YcgR